jgi:hypothetical protein
MTKPIVRSKEEKPPEPTAMRGTATAQPEQDPDPEPSLTVTRKVVVAATGLAGFSCVGLLLCHLISHRLAGPAPIIETLLGAVTLAACIGSAPRRIRRAAAGSMGATSLVVATVAIFAAAPGTPGPGRAAAPSASRSRPATLAVPGCPVPAGSPRLGPATSPEPGDRTSASLGEATIDGAESDDGKPGIGPGMVICVTVRRAPTLDRQLWLVVRLNPREGLTHPLYFPKFNITLASGSQTLPIPARCPSATTLAGIGNVRTLMIVSADASASQSLQRNYDADQACDSQYDNAREQLPPGAVVISNQGNVTRAR